MQNIPEIIKNRIFTIREKQVMLDSDLAKLYDVPTKVLNQAVKRNFERFPEDFMFQLTSTDMSSLRSQIVTLDKGRGRYTKYQPFAFTEQGVAMLSSVLKSQKAIEINIQIIRAFVEMRKFISNNLEIFQKIEKMESKQKEYDYNFQKIFQTLEEKSIPNKRIFFDGQVFDAHKFVSDLVRSANLSIILVDNYIDDSVLTLFSKKQKKVKVVIYTRNSKSLELDTKKFNQQYHNLELKEFDKSHDRFLIIDNNVYHFGASLKDLGKKWFAFSKFDKEGLKIIENLTKD